jgi:hypothetical protein
MFLILSYVVFIRLNIDMTTKARFIKNDLHKFFNVWIINLYSSYNEFNYTY